MPKPNTCDLSIILDRSASMESVLQETLRSLNKFLEDQKAVPGDCLVSLYLFNHCYEVAYVGLPPTLAPAVTLESYVPAGYTALLDAIGRTVDDTGKRLAALPEELRPSQVVVVILTDGQENASHQYTRQRVFDMITHQRQKYRWEFVFLGANQDAIATGAALGLPAAASSNYEATDVGTRYAFQLTSGAIASYRTSGQVGTKDGLLAG